MSKDNGSTMMSSRLLGEGVSSPKKKKASPVRRGKKKRDPNAPSPPMSAYSFFFKEMQATVKTHNPEAKFGEVSKIVASMWDTLDEEAKSTYRKRNEDDKERYKKELLDFQNSQSQEVDDEDEEESEANISDDPEVTAVFAFGADHYRINVEPIRQDNPVTENVCVRKGCSNNAVKNSEWEDEYCSNDCVVMHCGNVFEEWIQERTVDAS